ncbi:MAG: hypothetical protein HQK72_12375 [Desulfamplus sp.]|nr:hypothetical protein [Desulfamplus sp.]
MKNVFTILFILIISITHANAQDSSIKMDNFINQTTDESKYDSVLTELRKYAEILYFLTGGPIVVIILLYGLKQIKVGMRQVRATEEIAKKQNMRHSLKETIEQCNFFKDKILYPFMGLTNPENNNGKPKIKPLIAHAKIIVEIKSENEIEIKFDNNIQNDLNEELKKYGKEMMETANNCELFALYFTSGVAISKVAFRPCAPNFCKIVDCLIPLIIEQNKNEKLFVNTLSLYIEWKKQLQNEIIEEQMSKLKYQQGSIKIEDKLKPII